MFEWFREAFDMNTEEPTIEMEVVEEEPVKEVEAEPEEIEEEEITLGIIDKLEELDSRVSNVEQSLEIVPEYEDDYEEPELTLETMRDNLNNQIRKKFLELGKYSDDTEITEEFLQTRSNRQAFVPWTASEMGLSVDRVKEALLNK